MGNKFLRLFLIVISSFAASVGLASCSVIIPGNTLTTSDSSTGPHSHNYNKQVIKDAYKVSNADCEHAATYYYSCSCGDIGIETFEFGSPLGHDWHYEYLQTSEGEYYQSGTCSRCDAKEKRTIQSVNNLNFEVINEEEKTCQVTGFKKFYYDERDNNIFIPKMWNDYKVTLIGEFAFYGCYSLRSIVIPDSVTSISNSAFRYCNSLRSIIVKEGNTVYDSREDCNAIIKTSTNTLIAGCATTIIPDNVASICEYAFYRCTSLRSILIPNSVTSIGGGAFGDCTSLRSVTIGNGVTSIGGGAFNNCYSLNSIVIPDSVTTIDSSAFWNCNSLSDVYYIGSEEQWNAIYIGPDNDELKSATIHYNYMG